MTRRTIQADRMLPVTEEERATYETERTSALRVIGHLDVQWTKLRKQFAERQKEAEKARATAGDQEASAAQDLGDGELQPGRGSADTLARGSGASPRTPASGSSSAGSATSVQACVGKCGSSPIGWWRSRRSSSAGFTR